MDREQRRTQILDVAETVFAEKGYHHANIDHIVARARVARGTFYLYFADLGRTGRRVEDAFAPTLLA